MAAESAAKAYEAHGLIELVNAGRPPDTRAEDSLIAFGCSLAADAPN
jgi:hypothetical protein